MVSVSMNALSELLQKRLSEWEVVYEHELGDAELRIWLDTFQNLRITEALLESALRIVQTKVTRFPKPGHLTAAIEEARNERDRDASKRSASTYLEEMNKTPHISERSPEERAEIKRIFDEAVAKILAKNEPKFPHARTGTEKRQEIERQKTALAASQTHATESRPIDATPPPSAAAPPTASPTPIAVESPETAPEDLAEEPPYKATDQDIPW